jgi:hypothetical protein
MDAEVSTFAPHPKIPPNEKTEFYPFIHLLFVIGFILFAAKLFQRQICLPDYWSAG